VSISHSQRVGPNRTPSCLLFPAGHQLLGSKCHDLNGAVGLDANVSMSPSTHLETKSSPGSVPIFLTLIDLLHDGLTRSGIEARLPLSSVHNRSVKPFRWGGSRPGPIIKASLSTRDPLQEVALASTVHGQWMKRCSVTSLPTLASTCLQY